MTGRKSTQPSHSQAQGMPHENNLGERELQALAGTWDKASEATRRKQAAWGFQRGKSAQEQ